jgi:hypothetical protein
MLDHGLELLEVLRISMPTPRGQEAQLDQVVEAHRSAREYRIDDASGKEKDDPDQFSTNPKCVPATVMIMAIQPELLWPRRPIDGSDNS